MFKGFKPQGLQKIANRMGYTGSLEGFDSYLQQNPDKQNMMNMYNQRAMQMASGGLSTASQVRQAQSGLKELENSLQGTNEARFLKFPMKTIEYIKNKPDDYTENELNILNSIYNYRSALSPKPQVNLGDVPDGMAQGGAVRKMQEGGMAEIKTMAVGEDDNNPQMPKGIGPITRALGEDGSGGIAQIKTMAVGEDEGDMAEPQPILGPRPKGLTRAMGEDGTGPAPKQTQADIPTVGTGEGQEDLYKDVTYTETDEDGNEVEKTRPANVTDVTARMAKTGAIPKGAVTQVETIQTDPRQEIATGTGEVGTQTDATVSTADTTKADDAQKVTAETYDATTANENVKTALEANLPAQTDPNDPRAKVVAAQQTKSAVSDLDAAQGNAYIMENPVQREIQDGELISGVADAEKAAKFTEQIQAATATPTEKATVQGQLASLTENFDANNPPAWAAGALRGIQGQLAARGLGASSMAGQALIQATLESALPIAQADANIQAQFETQNLSNRQQRAMLAAQQRATFMGQEFDQAFQARVQNSARIGDIANMNFTAEQNIAMENSRAVNTMNLQNLSNKQAMVMAEAAALSQLDMANLSNNQQAAVQNAQNFLQMEMANLSNEQQTAMFNTQTLTQSILTDQAAKNAAAQFNATSENQTNQFMANLANNISQFNATQANAQAQFNAGEENTIERFNAEVRNQRDQFNANNQLQIAQSNAVWRREIATADTAAINRANELNAKAVLDVSNTAYANMWNYFSDTMEWAWRSSESELDRINALAVAEVSKEAQQYSANATKAAAGKNALGKIIGSIFS